MRKIIRAAKDFWQRFLFKGLWFDPQFAESERRRPPLDGARITRLRRIRNANLIVEDDRQGIFYPAVYKCWYRVNEHASMRRTLLLSFRFGHRGLFRRGNSILFNSLTRIRIQWRNGVSETALAVLGDETASIAN